MKPCFLLAPIALLFAFSGCDSGLESREGRPNFVVVLVDDQGWNGTSVEMVPGDSLSRSDYHETPFLERFAAEGMRFSEAYSAAPVCAPSRYAIQFGKTPARLSLIRVGMNSDHIYHDEGWSLPKALKAVDSLYVAGHFGKWGMGSTPEVMGYDVSNGPTQNREGGFVNDRSQWDAHIKDDPKRIMEVTRQGVAFMSEQVRAERPFYLQLSHWAVHANLEARQASLDKYEAKPRGAQQVNPAFAAMTEDLDAGMGAILEALDSLGIADQTYVVYMSDNGSVPNIPGARKYERSYNHPLSRGKWDALEGGVRVPLIIRGPDIAPGSHSAVPVSGVDLMPTLVALTGARETPRLDSLDGGSFAAVLHQKAQEVIRPVDGLFFHVPYRNGIALKRPHSAIRQGDFKLLLFQDDGEVRLYNLRHDIGEENDLAAAMPDKAAAMRLALSEYLSDVRAPRWQEGITWKAKPLVEFDSFH